ncbi:hypothetical protein [Anaerotruncus colihominis]|uniref:Uncharacterized protein n=2 Tax=Anaerotruncus colihominis TaxID=169435 RepID=A0A1Y4MV74_9FIRM|nr:hypothetical protein [Anaerotruncus colihominis]OUP67752.1 hypothetical protein B5F11_16810 [Anaerotruncus colihominis]OUP72059.1 hypothetical protein B5F10_16230 [Anaerotruncus colihominis]
MKKLLAAALAVATVASLSTVSFAANEWPVDLPTEGVTAIFDDGTGAAYDGANTVKPDKTLYFEVGNMVFTDRTSGDTYVLYGEYYTDKDLFKVKTDKGDENAKMIKSMALSEKSITYKGVTGRGPWFEIKLNDDYTDDEFKINPSFTVTAKDDFYATTTQDANNNYILRPVDGDNTIPANSIVVNKGDKIIYDVGKYYISNSTDNADQDYMAGTGGIVLKPTKNDDNEITWEDENNTIATLRFYSDDDAAKFFPKLTTKWDNADYAEYFADQNAFIFDFVGRAAGETKIASTSRATLELYNPYYDWDEDVLTVAPEDCVIYQIVDGELVDVTASFTALQNDDGDYVFQTKTRELGCYIIAEAEAAAVVDPGTTAPTDEKPVPNTGR